MKKLFVEPTAWPCKFSECPPGPFVFHGNVGMKSEYKNEQGYADAYNEAGEFWWAGTSDFDARDELVVQPCEYRWIEVNE